MSVYKNVSDVLDEVFTGLLQTTVNVYLFSEGQSPSSALYGVSREADISYTEIEDLSAFYVKNISEVDIRNFGQAIQDATVKVIFRTDTLKENELWFDENDRVDIDTKDKIEFDGDTFRIIKVQEIGKIEGSYVAVVIFGVEDR